MLELSTEQYKKIIEIRILSATGYNYNYGVLHPHLYELHQAAKLSNDKKDIKVYIARELILSDVKEFTKESKEILDKYLFLTAFDIKEHLGIDSKIARHKFGDFIIGECFIRTSRSRNRKIYKYDPTILFMESECIK